MKIQFVHTFEDIISIKNLLKAWEEFIPGKRGRKDTQQFSMRLMDNIFLLHHAIYRKLHPFFDRTFIADSFSCRLNKGTHRAISRFLKFFRKTSKNSTKTCWVLKCDIKKFFATLITIF